MNEGARSSVWIEQHPSKVMVVGSNPIEPDSNKYKKLGER